MKMNAFVGLSANTKHGLLTVDSPPLSETRWTIIYAVILDGETIKSFDKLERARDFFEGMKFALDILGNQ